MFKTTVRPMSRWIYQLQNVDVDAIHRTEADVVVIDRHNDDGELWTTAQIRKMQTTAAGSRRRVLSYVSIGEAEDYRTYWPFIKGSPFIDKENPDWKGNYKVKFWMPEWQSVIFKEVASIMNQGFDGVYLDIVDAYEYYDRDHPDAIYEMADFVIAISERVKVANPAGWVIPQNGEGLLVFREYRAAIDGIGKEDIFYGATENGKENSRQYSADVCAYLAALNGTGKPVLLVEYDLSEGAKDRLRRTLSSSLEYVVVLYTGRQLDKLVAGT